MTTKISDELKRSALSRPPDPITLETLLKWPMRHIISARIRKTLLELQLRN